MNEKNLTLLTDFYELTMMQGYYNTKKNETVIFDLFYQVQNVSNQEYYHDACIRRKVMYHIKRTKC